MGGHAREERAGLVGLEAVFGQPDGRADADEPESGEGYRRAGEADRVQQPVDDVLADERGHQMPVRVSVSPEAGAGRVHRSVQEGDPSTVQRMRQRDVGVHPLEPVLRERELPEHAATPNASGWIAEHTSCT